MCDSDTEICVKLGTHLPPGIWSCKPVPDGCEDDHTCGCAESLCEPPAFQFCTDKAVNTLECLCFTC